MAPEPEPVPTAQPGIISRDSSQTNAEVTVTFSRRHIFYTVGISLLSVLFLGPHRIFFVVLRALIIRSWVLYRVRYKPRDDDNRETAAIPDQRKELLSLRFDAGIDGLHLLLKGSVTWFATILVCVIITNSFFWRDFVGMTSFLWSWAQYPNLLFSLASLPLSVYLETMVVREITDVRLYDWRSPKAAFRALWTSYEWTNAWALLRMPMLSMFFAGFVRLFAADASNWAVSFLVDTAGQEFNSSQKKPEEEDFMRAVALIVLKTALWFLLCIPVKLLAVAIICPLEVACVRLAAQRDPGPSPADEEVGDKALASEHLEGFEAAVRLREPRYSGLFNCLANVRREEGWRALYRGWWVTLLLTAHGASWELAMTGWYW